MPASHADAGDVRAETLCYCWAFLRSGRDVLGSTASIGGQAVADAEFGKDDRRLLRIVLDLLT